MSNNTVTLSQDQVDLMKAAQDDAAAQFWAYPDQAWQMDFQADWLIMRFGVTSAVGPDGLAWGDSQEHPAAE